MEESKTNSASAHSARTRQSYPSHHGALYKHLINPSEIARVMKISNKTARVRIEAWGLKPVFETKFGRGESRWYNREEVDKKIAEFDNSRERAIEAERQRKIHQLALARQVLAQRREATAAAAVEAVKAVRPARTVPLRATPRPVLIAGADAIHNQLQDIDWRVSDLTIQVRAASAKIEAQHKAVLKIVEELAKDLQAIVLDLNIKRQQA